ncbi:hypothetical protein SpCBS45565_g02135 [Spizellomyces sp. 'palustris']|nr:hypothetical protein SpCBS45565_g02135 [Spizellomyces sp. 'palustris']
MASNDQENKAYQDTDQVPTTYSEPAHNTRSQNPMPDEKPLSQTATEGDEIITYGGRQGFASMKERDPERQKEIASKGGSGPRG